MSKKFKNEGKDLREAIAAFARMISTEVLDPHTLEPYTAGRLIALNKAPGEEELQVRPIGVGEVLRRIVGKSISWTLNDEIQIAGGPLQVSTGLKGGAEAAIHAMKKTFDDESTDAIILVDAANAFNRLNRRAAPHNMQYLCHCPDQYIQTSSKAVFVRWWGNIIPRKERRKGMRSPWPSYGTGT